MLSPTAPIMCSYQPPMAVLCIRSMKVSVLVTLRMAPKTDRSAKLGLSPVQGKAR